MKRFKVLLCCLILAASLSTGYVFAEEPVIPGSPWSTEGEVVSATNVGGKYYMNAPEAFYLGSETLSGDYTVSTTLVGSEDRLAETDRYDAGILAWYFDQDNWISLSVSWWNGFATGKVVDVLTVICENGNLVYKDHYFDNSAYAGFKVFQKGPTEEIELSVSRAYDAQNGFDVFSFYVEDELIYVENIGFSAGSAMRGADVKTGFVCSAANTVFSFSKIKIQYPGIDGQPVEYAPIAGVEGTKAAGNWSFTDGKFSVAAAESSPRNHVILKNEYAAQNYKLEVTAELSEVREGSEVLISGFYLSSNQFLFFYLRKGGDGWTAVAKGILGSAPMEESAAVEVSDPIVLTVQKIGATMEFSLGGSRLFFLENEALAVGTDVLFGAGQVNATFAAELSELAYKAYDFYQQTVDGVNYWISAKDMLSVEIGEGSLTILSEAERETIVLWEANTSGKVEFSSEFSGTATEFGQYIYYADQNHYVAVIIGEGKAVLKSVVGGVENFSEVGLSGEVTSLRSTMNGYEFNVSAGETVLFDKVRIEGIDLSSQFQVGLFAKGGELAATGIDIKGFVPFEDQIVGEYILRGDSYETWQLVGEKLVGSLVNGTTWNQTLAFRSLGKTPSEGYNVGAAIQVTQQTGTEWKAGLLPWYVDAGNFVYVWLSQWSGASPTITMICYLDGQVCGEGFRETPVFFNLTDVNELEISVSGDEVRVYLNQNFAPVAVTTFEGLGSKSETATFMGFNIFNVTSEFSKIAISDGERIFANTIPPEISMVGSIPESGTVGTKIVIPIFMAEGATGEAATEVTVTLGGERIELTKNSFTPASEGSYVVTVVATDLWGVTSTQEFHILVQAAEEPARGCGCGSSVGAASGYGVIFLGAVLAIRKKKQ